MEFKETCIFHENENNIGFCLNQKCRNNPEFCYDCKKEKHKDHINDCLQFNNTQEMILKNYETLKQQRNELKNIVYEMTRDFQDFLENNFQRRLDELYKINEIYNRKDYNLAKQNMIILSKLKTQSQAEQIRLNLEKIMQRCQEFKQFIKQVDIHHFEQNNSEYIQCSDISVKSNCQQRQNELDPFEIFQYCQCLLVEAKALKNQGNFQQSLEKLNEVVSFDKDNDDAHHEAAQILHSLGQNCRAFESVQKCLSSNPKNGRGYFLKGKILLKLHNYKEAIKALEMAEKYPENINAQFYVELAFSLSNCHYYKRAIDYCDQAIQFEPECASAYNNKASALKNLQKYDEALLNYNKAIELSPGQDDFIINKGVFLYERNRYNEALAEFEKASQVNQLNPRLYLNKGQLLQRMNRYEEARQCYNLLIQYDPYNQEGQLLLNQLQDVIAQNQYRGSR